MVNEPNKNDWCFAWAVDKVAAGLADRATLIRGAKWNPGQVINVSFLDDEHGLRDRIKQIAVKWTNDGEQGMARLKLVFRTDTTDTPIRISFKRSGNWSAVGTTCQNVLDRGEPTMNFGNLGASPPEEAIRRAVLHEFGHALGLDHEHMSPVAGIRWNKEAVYRELAQPLGSWTRDEVDRNMFKVLDEGSTNFTEFDPDSIMLYPIPARWTEDGFSRGLNTNLSQQDKKFIAEQYP